MSELLLRPQDRERLLRLLAEHLPEVTVWAYGSRVNGEAHDASDLDLVLRSPDLSPIDFLRLDDFVDALRESNIPILIEARDWARLPVSFHREIEKNYVVVCEGAAGDSETVGQAELV
jgi:predicted nucleotidyltransferase